MHDFLLAKEIIDTVIKVANEKGLKNIKSVSLEIGSIALSHDGHTEDISVENLQFGIENIAKNTMLKGAKFEIKKVEGESWRITDIEVE